MGPSPRLLREQRQPHHRQPLEARTRPRKHLDRQPNASLALRRSRYPINVGRLLLLGVMLAAPMISLLPRDSTVGMGVFAAPCDSTASPAGEAQLVIVTPVNSLNITMFDCEDGNFEVVWSDAVNVPNTIVIGARTTVMITGETGTSSNTDDATSAGTAAATGEGSSSLSDEARLEQLTTSRLSLPRGLTSTIVGVGPPDESQLNDTTTTSGPIFHVVTGGTLILQDLIVEDGYAANAADSENADGAGIFAVGAEIYVTRCKFSNNFAVHWGGGIYAKESIVVAVDSVFEGCRAGFRSISGEHDFDGAGGSIAAKDSDVLVDGCLFEGNYANNKGGAIHHEDKHISVIGSVFYNNVVGSESEEEKDPKGQGADISLAECEGSFDGTAACRVNDTVFMKGYAGNKGGAVSLSGGDDAWDLEFHRCWMEGSSAGYEFEDKPQGEGGAFAVGEGVTLILSDCLLKGISCGNKGGVLTLSSVDSQDDPGAKVVMRNSSFESNEAYRGSGGVVNMGDFAIAVVEGDGNVFERNECYGDGGVFAASENTLITIEGGLFVDNIVEESGAVIWSKGNLTIEDGNFNNNSSPENGGVLFASEFSTFTLAGGHFEGNKAQDGGVINMISDSTVKVEGGVYTGNVATSDGGVFSVLDGSNVQITGGNFSKNEADFGGFLYRQGMGETSCIGASILHHVAVDGGAIYAIDDATVDWACDIRYNSAISAPGIYARESTTVTLREISLVDNSVSRGSVIVLIGSHLDTYQVKFNDTSGSLDLSAVQVNEGSSYMAEDTSFVGFAGEGVVFSEGELFLDDCDFTGSNSPILVFSAPNSTVVIRNAALGDNNYVRKAEASSRAGVLPDADSFTNRNITCNKDMAAESGDAGELSGGSSPDLCSVGSACLDGDLGVYCECYYPQRTISSSKRERCVSGDATELALTVKTEPGETFFPGLVEGDVLLSFTPLDSQAQSSSSASSSGNGTGSGLVWTVQAVETTDLMVWTVFPSTGLLVPGQSITLRVVTEPSDYFDGTTSVIFGAIDFRLISNISATVIIDDDDDHDDDVEPDSAAAHLNQAEGDALASSVGEIYAEGIVATVSFDVTFFHCAAGSFWNLTLASKDDFDFNHGDCKLCTEEMDGASEGVDCSTAGATIGELPVRAGYWRATLSGVFIRECSSEEACKGGTTVMAVQDYCGEGYEGPQCTVCSAGFGKGAANQCHVCSDGFKIGMYFLVVISALITLVVVALLAIYLIGGKDAVSSTVASTKESVLTVKRRRAGLTVPSGDGRGSIGFGPLHARSGRSSFSPGYGHDRSKRVGGKSSTHVDINSRASSVGTMAGYGGNTSSFHDGGGGGSGGGSGGGGGRGIRRQSRFLRGLHGLSGLFGNSRRGKTTPGGSGADSNSVSSFGNNPRGTTRVMGSRAASGVATEAGLTSAYGGEAADSRRRDELEGKSGKPPPATRIGQTLAGLPLSKVKIVIVVWQISSAFADVTNAGFPPVYEKFLAVIGMFSMDLGWVLSASCLATGVTFYDKLLIVTTGPIFLLGLLGITFRLGWRPAKPRVSDQPIINSHSWAGSSADASARALARVSGKFGSTTEAVDRTSPHDISRSNTGPIPDQGLPANATGVTGSGAPAAGVGDAADKRQASWMIHVRDDGAAEPGRNASDSQGPLGRPIVRSQQSLRRMWQAGPGNGTDSEQNRLWGLFARHTTMSLIILYLVYSQVSTVVLQTFACEDYHEIETSYLRADSRIECYTQKHTMYRIYAAFMIVLYPLGIPAAFAFLLVRQRSAINPPTDRRLEKARGREHVVNEKIEQRRLDQTVTPTSFLWGAYYPNRYYFEVFECMRRLLLTGVLVFVPDTSGQVAYGCIFAFISLWAFELQRPHIDGLEIQLYRTGCLVIFFTNFLALIIQAELAQADSSSTAVYSVVLVMVHVMFILSICWNSWATMKATFSRRHVQGMVLGVDVVTEEYADNILGPEKQKGDKKSANPEADFKVEEDEMVPAWQTEGIAKPPSFDTNKP